MTLAQREPLRSGARLPCRDLSDREAIIAIEPTSRQALGDARYVRLSEDPEAAEIAIVVVDDWHRRGVGPALLRQLTSRARQGASVVSA